MLDHIYGIPGCKNEWSVVYEDNLENQTWHLYMLRVGRFHWGEPPLHVRHIQDNAQNLRFKNNTLLPQMLHILKTDDEVWEYRLANWWIAYAKEDCVDDLLIYRQYTFKRIMLFAGGAFPMCMQFVFKKAILFTRGDLPICMHHKHMKMLMIVTNYWPLTSYTCCGRRWISHMTLGHVTCLKWTNRCMKSTWLNVACIGSWMHFNIKKKWWVLLGSSHVFLIGG